MPAEPFIRWFNQIGLADIAEVGGKNASLGEMHRRLSSSGVRVPDGFAITAGAYRHFMRASGLDALAAGTLAGLDTSDVGDLAARGRALREAVATAPMPEDLDAEIAWAYARLGVGQPIDVAIRSSATAEDLPGASFAGQHETFLNVTGREAVIDACRRAFASLFTDRAISYRAEKGFAAAAIALSVGVQRMVRSDLACSGVMFTLDTETGFRDVVLINASYGLGEPTVQGAVTPDEYCVFKPTLDLGLRPVIRRTIGSKATKLVYGESGHGVVMLSVPAEERAAQVLVEDEILTLARWACAIEDAYGSGKTPLPMDIEWAKDGRTGGLFILQARPVHRIASAAELPAFRDGEVLVVDKTDPHWEPIMKKAAAIVTNRGGRTCHAAIVSRELGLPAIVGAETATTAFDVERIATAGAARPATRIMMNVSNPDEALRLSFIPNDGVGLARLEFIIGNAIGIHPMALVHYDTLDAAARADVDRLTGGRADRIGFFVETLAEGIATIAAAFYPKDVIVRLSDFKTNEYARLAGGAAFEPLEENPMIGFRGASRYYHPRYREGFALECLAIKRAREVMGLVNIRVMVPFCRTLGEAEQVVAELARNGLTRHEHGLELYMMVEVPSNVVLLPGFAEFFDGFSIGSSDLTQLTLGVDRDSAVVAPIFDERNEAVKALIAQAIQHARRLRRKIGLCGQAPSDYPEFAAFLVECGIDSISLGPDAVIRTTAIVQAAERPALARTS